MKNLTIYWGDKLYVVLCPLHVPPLRPESPPMILHQERISYRYSPCWSYWRKHLSVSSINRTVLCFKWNRDEVYLRPCDSAAIDSTLCLKRTRHAILCLITLTEKSIMSNIALKSHFFSLCFNDWQCNALQVRFRAWRTLNSLLLLLICGTVDRASVLYNLP